MGFGMFFIVPLQAGRGVKVITRDNIASPTALCIKCNCRTRSHVLEVAQYEEYEELIEDELEEFQGRKKFVDEEKEQKFVIKYALVDEPIVMCHKCWVKKKDQLVAAMELNHGLWLENMSEHLLEAKKFLKDWKYYQLSKESRGELEVKVKQLKAALKEEYV